MYPHFYWNATMLMFKAKLLQFYSNKAEATKRYRVTQREVVPQM
jgi:hypothetical protein